MAERNGTIHWGVRREDQEVHRQWVQQEGHRQHQWEPNADHR